MSKAEDTEFRDCRITEVVERPNGWEIKDDDGWVFWVDRSHGVKPYAGQTARFYGRGIGCVVRGLDIDGREVFYCSEDEQRATGLRAQEQRDADKRAAFEATGRAKLDASYATLPKEFKNRLDGLRHRNPDFRWKLEDYEMFVCEQAVVIASTLKDTEKVCAFGKEGWEQQKLAVPELSADHSGNTFGAAVRLAWLYLSRPELVEREHGALCPLLGCREYGCASLEKERDNG